MGFTLNQLEQERQIRKLQKKEDKDTSNYEQLSNLPKINNVELKGNKTTGDLGINADNVMMSDGVTSVEDAMGNMRMTKLWENPSPTNSFAAQNVTLSSDDYDFIIAVCNATTSGRTISTLIQKGTSGTVAFSACRGAGASYTTTYNRDFERTDNTHYAVDSAYTQNSNGARTEDNTKLIPVIIYGIKLT